MSILVARNAWTAARRLCAPLGAALALGLGGACIDAGGPDLEGLCRGLLGGDGEAPRSCHEALAVDLPEAYTDLPGRVVVLGVDAATPAPDPRDPQGERAVHVYVVGIDEAGDALAPEDFAGGSYAAETPDGGAHPLKPPAVLPAVDWAAPELMAVSLLVDHSSSMREVDFERAAGLLDSLVRALPAGLGELEVAVFSEASAVVQPLTADRDAASAALVAPGALPRGQTALYDAVGRAAERFDGRAAAMRVMVVLTDGFDNASTTFGLGAAIDALRSRGIVPIPVATFLADPAVLKKVAGAFGVSLYAPDFGRLTDLAAGVDAALSAIVRLDLGGIPAGASAVRLQVQGLAQEIPLP